MHENAGNLGMRIPYYKYMVENLGVNIMSVAYRGYSYSDPETPDEAGLKKDADAVIDFLESPNDPNIAPMINKQLIFLLGRSLGGAVVTYMAE